MGQNSFSGSLEWPPGLRSASELIRAFARIPKVCVHYKIEIQFFFIYIVFLLIKVTYITLKSQRAVSHPIGQKQSSSQIPSPDPQSRFPGPKSQIINPKFRIPNPRFQIPNPKIFGLVRFGTVWYGLVRFGSVWYGLVRFGMVWYGLVR